MKRSRKIYLAQYHKDQNVSDEGNTSEYSVSPSSKSSTLESTSDIVKMLNMPNLPLKRPNQHSDGSSDSESEENITVVTQVSYPTENLV